MALSSDDLTTADFVERDRALRARILRPPVILRHETDLVHALVLASEQHLPGYPFLVAIEWHVKPGDSALGIGDLVFGNGTNGFAVVEVKFDTEIFGMGRPRRNRRTKSRQNLNKAYKQARKYAQAWRASHPNGDVTAHVCSNIGDAVYVYAVDLGDSG